MLTVVQHQQHVAVKQSKRQSLFDGLSCALPHSEREADRMSDKGRICNRSEVDKAGSVSKRGLQPACNFQRETGLTHASRTGECHQTGPRQAAGYLLDFTLSTNKARDGFRQPVAKALRQSGRRLVRSGQVVRDCPGGDFRARPCAELGQDICNVTFRRARRDNQCRRDSSIG
jgi:hypothetical protein